MPRCRVVIPEVVRIPLSDGDWIDVIKELNGGEYVDYLTAMADGKSFAKILAYVQAWSLIGLDGQPIPFGPEVPEDERRAAVRSQDRGTLRELNAALDRHEAAEEAAIDAKKKTPASVPASSPPSPSVAT